MDFDVAVLKLFKGVYNDGNTDFTGESPSYLTVLQETLPKGFIFSPEVIQNNSLQVLLKLTDQIGLLGEQLNSSFHKSWKKIRTASIKQLMIEQIVHYITTYGYETLGIFDKETVFIPEEALDIPKRKNLSLNLVIIREYTHEQIKEKLMGLLTSGIALHKDTIEAVMVIAKFLPLDNEDLNKIKNKEVRIRLMVEMKLLPQNPEEFLRTLIYIATGESLLIKNTELINKILLTSQTDSILECLKKYEDLHGLPKLASIFNRFKPLFLAFRYSQKLKPIINRISKLSKKYHKPIPEDYLNEVTKNLNNRTFNIARFQDELKKVNIFRKIRLAYALKFRTMDCKSIVHTIRNGKSFSKGFYFNNKSSAEIVLTLVLESIAKDLHVEGKRIFLPNIVEYALPATEKQFVGNFPAGSCVKLDKNLLVGVHWFDHEESRVDLDLSLMNFTRKFGWDGHIRNDQILFSGDNTSAPKPKGASEIFYVKGGVTEDYLVNLNFFNYCNLTKEIPFKLFIGSATPKSLDNDYLIDPNDVIVETDAKIGQTQQILGMISTTPEDCKFYFIASTTKRLQSAYYGESENHTLNFFKSYYKNSIKLADVLKIAGATIVTNPKEEYDVDLSPSQLQKDTILNLLKE